jgi:hypothetical protein
VVHRAVEDVLDLSNPLVRSFLSGPRSFLASLGRWLAYPRLLPSVGWSAVGLVCRHLGSQLLVRAGT